MLKNCTAILNGFRKALAAEYSTTISDDAKLEFLSKSWAEIRYHLDNAPGWLFGMWFSKIPATKNSPAKIQVNCFAQLEAFIDKFKPSHSTFSEEFIINVKDLERYLNPEPEEEPFDIFRYSDVFQMHTFIIDHRYDAEYLDLYPPYSDYYRLPNRFKVFWCVTIQKFKQSRRDNRRARLVKKCKQFIESRLVPAFANCRMTLKWYYTENCYPAFDLLVKDPEGLHSLEEINACLDSAWVEYLVAKWNHQHAKDGLVRLYIAYEFSNSDGSVGHASLPGNPSLKELREDVVVKKCRWFDKESVDE